jgi:hypothetical protein
MSQTSLDLSDLPKSRADRLDLVVALLGRSELRSEGIEALRLRYPHLPEAFLSTAVHHLYGDLPGALVDLLAILELSLREPHRELGYGAPFHVLDHLYNWFQLQALLPHGLPELDELAREAEEALDQGDTPAVKAALRELRARLDGNLSAPEFG